MDPSLLDLLVCPRDHLRLTDLGSHLLCPRRHKYPVVDGVPILLLDDVPQTAPWTESAIQFGWKHAGESYPPEPSVAGVDRHVQEMVARTGGHFYKPLVGRLTTYPIPEIRLPNGSGLFLDIGCNWGRWCVAGARKGFRPIGIDPSIPGVMAAKRVARQLNVDAHFVVGDARFLPFAAHTFSTVFSYSVIQHFSKDNARLAIAEAGRVLSREGTLLIQMPNRYGIRSFYHLARRRFSEGAVFDVRYWSVPELQRTFNSLIGRTRIEVDGYFGLGVQPTDAPHLPVHYRVIVGSSEILRRLSRWLRPMKYFADSVYARSAGPERGSGARRSL